MASVCAQTDEDNTNNSLIGKKSPDNSSSNKKEEEENTIIKVFEDEYPITSKDIQFVLETISKQAPYDKTQIKQIFYGICSSQTSTKIHHNINSKNSGEGKSYLLQLVSDLFPDSITLKFNNMTDKALYHQNGVEAIKDENTGKYLELKPILKELVANIEELQEKIDDVDDKGHQQRDRKDIKSWKSEIREKQEEYKDLKSKAVKIIDLDGKAFIFLDTPHAGLFNNLMSLLSQDSREQLYLFTDKDSSGNHHQSKTVVLRGAPLIMSTQVVDDTRNKRFAEKNRRFIHVNPNTSEEKIKEAKRQIAIRLSGLPVDIEGIVSSMDIEKSKEIVQRLCAKLQEHNKSHVDSGIKGSGIKIPYDPILSSSLSSEESWSMTVLTRLLNYIGIITKMNMGSRPTIVDTETGLLYPIAIYDDLKEALEIMKTASLTIRPYQQEWYNTIFLPAFADLGPEPNTKTNEYGTLVERESVVGITTKQLVDKMKQQGKDVSNESIYENYLRPLTKQGVINSVRSVINAKENLYYPVNSENETDASILPLTEDCRLIVNNTFDEKNVLEDSFRTIIERRSKGGGVKYKIIDIDGSEISLTELLDRYYFSVVYHTSCSVIEIKYYNNVIEKSSIVDEQSETTGEDDNIGQYSNDSENRFMDHSKDTVSSSKSSSIYGYTREDIEEFFAAENGQEEEHTLEDSICRSLIGSRNYKPFFYYCKEDPSVEFLYLKSIEDHIRLKDPQRHKAKLLEMKQAEQIDKHENKNGQDITLRS